MKSHVWEDCLGKCLLDVTPISLHHCSSLCPNLAFHASETTKMTSSDQSRMQSSKCAPRLKLSIYSHLSICQLASLLTFHKGIYSKKKIKEISMLSFSFHSAGEIISAVHSIDILYSHIPIHI